MKKLILSTIALLLVVMMFASVGIGNGTTTQYYPFSSYYNFNRSAAIYLQSEIGDAITIDRLQWYIGVANTTTDVPLKVYLKHTDAVTQTTANWATLISDATLVYEGTHRITPVGWFELNINDFAYNGTQNLMVLTESNGVPYVAPYPTFRYTSTSATYLTLLRQVDGSTYIDANLGLSYNRPNINLITPVVNPPAALATGTPANGATDVSGYATLSWQTAVNGPTGYKLFLGTNNPPTNIVNGTDLGDVLSYTSTLAYSTEYFWQVVPYNAFGDASACPIWSFTTMADPAITTFPYAQNFDGTWSGTPAAPTGWTVVNANNDGYTFRQSNQYITPTHSTPYAAHGMGNTNDYLITPPFNLTDIEARIKWWDKVESASYPNSYKVLLSTTNPSLASFTIELGTFICSNTAWTEHTINLDAYAGQNIYLAFYQYASPATNYGFGIDDFLLEEIPEVPILSYTPSTISFPMVAENATSAYSNVAISNIGGGTLNLNASDISIIGTDANQFSFTTATLPAALTAGQSVNIPVRFEPTSVGSKTATLRISYAGTNYDVALSGMAYSATAMYESFENTSFPPTGWTNPGSWSRSTSYFTEGVASAYKFTSTTQNILATPLLTISEDSSVMFMARTATSNTDQRIQVKYSSDRTTWTNIGDPIALNSNAAFAPFNVDLSTLSGNNYYIGFAAYCVSSTGSIYLDQVATPPATPITPEAVTLTAPVNAATNQSRTPVLTWNAAATGGIPTGYRVYLDQNADPTTLVATPATTSYTITTPLDWEGVYYWKVIAFNATGDAVASAIRSFTVMANPTVSAFPYSIGFEGTFPPANWSLAGGVLADPTTFSGAGSWIQDDWFNVSGSADKAARINIYSTLNGWMITPPLQIPEDNYEVKFDLALMAYGNNNPAATAGTDDIFAVLIGDGSTWTPANVVRQWDNAGSEYVYNSIPNTGISITLPLGSAGTKYIAFYGISTVSNVDNDLMVNNVLVRETPIGAPDAVTLVSPANAIANILPSGFTLNWSPAITGGAPDEYYLFMSQNLATIDSDVSFGPLTATSFNPVTDGSMTFGFSETWYWTVQAVNGSGDALPESPYSFTTISDPRITSLPYGQNFDAVSIPNLPNGWSKLVSATSSYAVVETATSTPVSTPNNLYMYNSGDSAANLTLYTPQITIPLNTAKLSFHARGSSTGQTLLIGTTDSPNATGTLNQLASVSLTVTNAAYTISLADYAGTDQYIYFKHGLGGTYRSIYIDNFMMEEMLANDLAATAIAGATYGFVGTPVTNTITIKNNGYAAQNSYTVYLKSVETRAILASSVETTEMLANATRTISLDWTPNTLGAIQVYGEVILATDQNTANDVTTYLSFNTLAAGSLVEGFEGGAIPTGWTVRNIDAGTNQWIATTVNPKSGTYAARIQYETSSLQNDDWLITPPLQLSSAINDNISFWMRSYSATDVDPWQVLISTTDTNPESFTMIDSGAGNMAAYVQKSYNLDSYGDAVIYLAIRYIGSYDWYLYVDDFVGPAVYVPENLDTPIVTISTADGNVSLDWQDVSGANSYYVFMADTPTPADWGTPIQVTNSEYTLTAEGKMFFRVQASTDAPRMHLNLKRK